jgi:K(+)-stimulated pyrophosphate-energized sodium pump
MDFEFVPWIGVAAAALALVVGLLLTRWVLRQNPGTERMQEVSGAVQEGAMAYLSRQYRTIAVVGIVIAVILTLTPLGWQTAAAFLVGAIFSGLCGFIGMAVSTRANARVAQAANESLGKSLDVAVKAGAVTGLMCVGLALLGVTAVYLTFVDPQAFEEGLPALVGLGFGGSLIALFARIGGGIYTKSADIGADLVGKVEAGIPEDDPRNPATIADNVGDNVGDCAGMAADLFETYAVTAIGAMLLGFLIFDDLAFAVYPLMLGAVAIVASIIGLFAIPLLSGERIMRALYFGVWVSAVLALIGFYPVTVWMLDTVSYFFAALIGVAVTVVIMYITDYYTNTNFRPVRFIARSSQQGYAPNVISGLSVGMESALLPILAIVAGILGAFGVAGGGEEGIYGIAIASMAMLSMTGVIVALDSYGPVTDNAGGVAEMAELGDEVEDVTDALDAVGNTTKATTKGYAIGSAALAAIVLFSDYTHKLRAEGFTTDQLAFSLDDPFVLAGLFLGGLIVLIFSALATGAVARASGAVVEEVRRQFKEIDGIMEGTTRPDYATCVDIVTKRALKEMVLPGLIPVVVTLLVGFLLGPAALGGLLIGVIVVGIGMAMLQNNSGGAWDNAKKYIEDGNFGGKGSEAHAAAVTGDTVGDPLKDTAGPAINPVIKVVNVVALLTAPLLALVFL